MRRLVIFGLSVFLIASVYGQSVKIEKKYQEIFAVTASDKLEISNKYGEIIVNTWSSDSVKISAIVLAEGKSQEIVNREISRVEVTLRKVGSLIAGVTKVDQGKGRSVFGDLVTQVEDISKTVLGSNRLAINYEVWIPAYLAIDLENKFGDIYLDNLNGKVAINLNQGDLRANRIESVLILKQSLGKHTIEYVKNADLNLRGVKSKINELEKLVIQSGSSEVWIEKVNHLQMDSRNDKYQVLFANSILGTGNFTDMNVEILTKTAELDFIYGKIYLAQPDRNFDNIKIVAKSTDVRMILDQYSYIKTRISGIEEKMVLPNSMIVMSKEKMPEGITVLSGFVGNTNTTFSQLELEMNNAQLVVSIQHTDTFTNKK